MGVDADRQSTARARRAAIIGALNTNLGDEGSDVLVALRGHLANERTMVVGADIDGLVSAMLFASVAPWHVGVWVVGSETVLVHPSLPPLPDVVQRDDVFGLDVFSPHFPSISNHPLLFGPAQRPAWLKTQLAFYDEWMQTRCEATRSINLSTWVGTRARLGTNSPQGLAYKYPLGTAQVALAALELAGRNPRIYDRQYLPWLIANCDGGVQTIRTYPWNVEGWWSALAAVVGPSSHTEALYRLVTEQRPTEFIDVDRRLRYDEPERSRALNSRWNLANDTHETVATAVELVRDLSGWPDPFLDGVEALGTWNVVRPTRNVLPTKGITKLGEAKVDAHLTRAMHALHVNFSVFKERGTSLGWLATESHPDVEELLGAAPLEDKTDPAEAALAALTGEDLSSLPFDDG